jgi:hypothetical protein
MDTIFPVTSRGNELPVSKKKGDKFLNQLSDYKLLKAKVRIGL